MDLEQRTRVVQEALSWLNTPYHSHARLKGVGVDCAMLLAEVYERAGVIDHVEPGDYPAQFGLHRDEEVFEGFILKHGVPVDVPAPGDCVLFKYGRCFSHGGIMVSSTRLVHAVLANKAVILSELTDGELVEREHKFYEVKP